MTLNRTAITTKQNLQGSVPHFIQKRAFAQSYMYTHESHLSYEERLKQEIFRSDMLLIFLHGLAIIFLRDSLCLSAIFPYRGNDTISWIFPIVPCHAFCMWHWPIGKNLDLSFIWGHHHLAFSGFVEVSRAADRFTTCYTVLAGPSRVETAVHGCNTWLSVWTLSCRCPVKLST